MSTDDLRHADRGDVHRPRRHARGASARPWCTGRSSTTASPRPTASACASPTPGSPNLGPVIKDLAAGAFDIGGLLLSQNPIIDQQDAFLTIDITGNAYEAGIGGGRPRRDEHRRRASRPTSRSRTSTSASTCTCSDGWLINLDCRLELQIPTTTIDATFDLAPSAADPSQGRRQPGRHAGGRTPARSTTSSSPASATATPSCIGDIVNVVAGPQIQSLVGSGFATKLGDPDGSGPADSPIADAIETALAEISIAGSVGEAVHAQPRRAVHPDHRGRATPSTSAPNADFFTSVGTGPTDCQPPAGAPDLDVDLRRPRRVPDLGADHAVGQPVRPRSRSISASAFNQLLGSMTECGILNQDGHPDPVRRPSRCRSPSSVLAALVPQFATKLPPGDAR